MRKFVLSALVLTVAAVAFVAWASEMPETITIDDCADKKAAVEFPHAAHFEYADCVTCHHTSEGLTLETAATMEVASCASCHNEPENAETPKCSEMSLKKNHYHISCVGCHKEAVAKNADCKAPTKCVDCHPAPAKS